MVGAKRSTKARVSARCAALGCSLEINEEAGRLEVDAPAGHRFRASDTHVIVADFLWGPRAEAWGDVLDRLSGGVEPCPPGGDENCRVAECPAAG